ncbi:hypothetical protein CTEN210_14015 [Chaetoceros tenuissimus]|uniref:Uncharacterized protein n=1 Tax=Chaetoceros tenuissimus TaxID=426638 RepID=A0AAD3D7Q4_9STRA|nr:hypothetical protein CTEN210_14015 [Chaetoceros tenuissimus]
MRGRKNQEEEKTTNSTEQSKTAILTNTSTSGLNEVGDRFKYGVSYTCLSLEVLKTWREKRSFKRMLLAVILVVMFIRCGSLVSEKQQKLPLQKSSTNDSLQTSSEPLEESIHNRTIERIDDDYPSYDTIKSILTAELKNVPKDVDNIERLAKFYELVYAFIAAFKRENINLFVILGSHLGARRHHGIIPFSEKDVDFAIFSSDEEKISNTIQEVLQSKSSWSTLKVTDVNFGFQIGHESMTLEHNFTHYIDFWMYDDMYAGSKVTCVGRNTINKGCKEWYHNFMGFSPPIFERHDYFPPQFQVFGSHKVPIPAKSTELETRMYKGSSEHWNTTCGSHRQWDDKLVKWVQIPKEKRKCSDLYNKYLFVFVMADGSEVLRQGDEVIHRSFIE